MEREVSRRDDEAESFAAANEHLRREAQIWWPHDMFVAATQDAASHYSCPAVIDASGRARHLVYGPFQRLDPGRWRASLVLRISAAAARRPLAVEFGAEPDFAVTGLPYGVPGLHGIDLECTFSDTDAAQLRLALKRAAFEGEIGFLGVALRFIDATPSNSPSSDDIKTC